ncbi:hypothetical protein SAMN04515668_0096 [Hymenobacter arizonensis]|uniref:Uncharacterized protein n=1 Tax=Hymenobacter arizonensis TaxID=1227077 RepID=A0A1I5SKI1_HYMAR|nr:hypothetical protein SAMN04515668_0096 [Hymenobacter arizonensis]
MGIYLYYFNLIIITQLHFERPLLFDMNTRANHPNNK